VLDGTAVSRAGCTAGLVVVLVVEDDELVHPVARAIPKTKTAIARAIPICRFWQDMFFRVE
jgi:hypothetical protein